jgi:hypothetical protein
MMERELYQDHYIIVLEKYDGNIMQSYMKMEKWDLLKLLQERGNKGEW